MADTDANGNYTGGEPDPIPEEPSKGFSSWLTNKIKDYGGEPALYGAGNLDKMFFGNQNIYDETLGQSKYSFGRRVFPLDLGSNASYNGHYMVININVQESSKMTGNPSGLLYNTPVSVLGNEYSKTDVLRFNIDVRRGGSSGYDTTALRPRFTRRIAESIAIYMPSASLDFTDAHEYEKISLTSFAGSVARFVAVGPLALAGGLLGGVTGAGVGASLVNSILNPEGQVINNAARLGGAPINPKVEVLYSNTYQRQFRFDFLMSPSNASESRAIDEIIRTLRFHAAPELRNGTVESFFWVPPAEFDITFFHRGEENKKIPRINTCVLEQVDVSYSPSGIYSTFHNGYPVQIRMQLTFRETEVVHKQRVLDGF